MNADSARKLVDKFNENERNRQFKTLIKGIKDAASRGEYEINYYDKSEIEFMDILRGKGYDITDSEDGFKISWK
mgnify:FL=1